MNRHNQFAFPTMSSACASPSWGNVFRIASLLQLLRSLYRAAVFICMLLAATIDGRVRHLFGMLHTGPEGAVWIHHWCRRIAKAMDIKSHVDGPLPTASLRFRAVVSNHLSYLDILLYSAATPCIMVAKTEVRSWPLLGWLTEQAGTIYVDRGGRPETYPAVNAAMARAFRSGLPVLFFPEGTTTPGDVVLPFRRGLFHSVLAEKVEVSTASISYSLTRANPVGSVAEDICWHGEARFAPHLLRFLGLDGVYASLQFDPVPIAGSDRYALSVNSQCAVASGYAHNRLVHR